MPRWTRLACLVLAASLAAPAFLLAEDETPGVRVPKELIALDDGDSFRIRWPERVEVVRILGIDAPEVQHLEHDIPYTQPFGERAAGFLEGCLAVADEVRLVRAAEKDPYGRSLGYVFLDGQNYSVLVVAARLAVENVSHFGDNGLPEPAARVLEAAKVAGPVPFEAPHRYRGRMRDVTARMRADGTYPLPERDESEPGK